MGTDLKKQTAFMSVNLCGTYFISYQDVQSNINRILQVANHLREMQFFDVELIDRLSIKLEEEWKKLYLAVERRTLMLEGSVSFHKSSKQVRSDSSKYFGITVIIVGYLLTRVCTIFQDAYLVNYLISTC